MMPTPHASFVSTTKKKKKTMPTKGARGDQGDGYEDEQKEEEEEEDQAIKVARRQALATILRDDVRTPYLTCQRCNSVTFINVNRVRTSKPRINQNHDDQDHDDTNGDDEQTHRRLIQLAQFEQLPVCSGCGTTKYLRAGVVSFQDKIDDEKQKIKAFEQKRIPATHLLLRIARGFLGRLAFRRRKRAHELYLWRIRVAATRIQTRVRGLQARRRTLYERCLRVIRTMHASILQHALAVRPDRPPVFWYEHAGELQILFWNYREFVRRAGGKPPLFKVESNLLEIAKRMLQREHELVSRIQARWRGLTTRLVFVEFKRQRGWLRGLQQSPAIKIQRLARAHYARRRCRALQAVKSYPDRLTAYRDERAQQRKLELAKAFRKKLLSKYRVAYQTTKTGKMLALAPCPEVEDRSSAVVDVQHSLRQPTTRTAGIDGSRTTAQQPLPQSAQQALPVPARHPNARKLLEMKRLMDAKQQHRRVRGPRLHILHAQTYAASTSASSPRHEPDPA